MSEYLGKGINWLDPALERPPFTGFIRISLPRSDSVSHVMTLPRVTGSDAIDQGYAGTLEQLGPNQKQVLDQFRKMFPCKKFYGTMRSTRRPLLLLTLTSANPLDYRNE